MEWGQIRTGVIDYEYNKHILNTRMRKRFYKNFIFFKLADNLFA